MQSSCIIIDVVLPDFTRRELRVTARYKQEFREFVRINNLSKEDTFALKNIVQSKLIQSYRSANNQDISPVSQHQKHIQQSPRFREFQKQLQKSKSSPQMILTNNLEKQVKVSYQLKLGSFGINKQPPQAPMNASHSLSVLKQHSLVNTNAVTIEEEQQQAPKQSVIPYQYQFQEPKKLYQAEEGNQSTQAYLNPKNDTTNYKKEEENLSKKIIRSKVIKKIDFQAQKIHPCFSWLYKAETDSFKSKRNQQIDHKQAKDYLQVEKYLLANNLKRVSPKVHDQLYKKSTESSKAKYSPKESKQFIFQTPQTQKELYHKKQTAEIKSGTIFKGSQWKSGSRCEKNIIMAEQQKMRSKSKEKQRQIRRRMLQQKDKTPRVRHEQYKSRSCEKCSPKKTPETKLKKLQKQPSTSQRTKKPYVSNVLLESYQQFYKVMHLKKSEISKITNQQ